MAATPSLNLPRYRSAVLAAREQLTSGRAKLRGEHDRGTPGVQLCAQMTQLADDIVVGLFNSALADIAEIDSKSDTSLADQVALVAHGGYGRRELAPFSDLDMMILHEPAATDWVAVLAERLMRDIFDVGLILGHSVRTVRQSITLSRQDPLILTSLTESRHVAGNENLVTDLMERLRRDASRRLRTFIPAIERVRREERSQYGETVYLLEPNIKRTRGGLRDIQLLRWIGFCRYGTTNPDRLHMLGALSKEEQQKIRATNEMLLRVRNEIHFHADKAYDQLDRAYQVHMAEKMGFEGDEGLLPVEQFMQMYFRGTRNVRYIVSRFVANARRGSKLARWFGGVFSHEVERDFRVGPYRIRATRRGLAKLKTDLVEVMRLADLANLYDKRIDHATWEAVREAAPQLSDEITPATAARFMSLISQPARVAELLRRLHELGVLEKFIPEMARTRGLLQFNEYHQYTVDEHSILAVQRAAEFQQDEGPLGRVYRSIEDKDILHLALLVHDLGKGFVEDHSEVGARIALDVANRLHLSPRKAEVVRFLTHKHLFMSHSALWRDATDPEVIIQLAAEVGSPDVLRMLYVLTAADIAAVGPGVLNAWKVELLTQLFERAMAYLSSDQPVSAPDAWLKRRRGELRQLVKPEPEGDWFDEQVEALPDAYLQQAEPVQIAVELRKLCDMEPGSVMAWGRYLPDHGAVEYTVTADESVGRGIFYRLTGALSSQGLEILSAQINTLRRGLVLDRFHVDDPDYENEPPAERMEEVSRRLVKSLQEDEHSLPTFRRIWGDDASAALPKKPPKVRADNTSSPDYTILDIFASNQTGLLYTIARTLYELKLSVGKAKIGTYIDQVVDVFYVTDWEGKKIEDASQLSVIRNRLTETIDRFEADAKAKT